MLDKVKIYFNYKDGRAKTDKRHQSGYLASVRDSSEAFALKMREKNSLVVIYIVT